jgi:hypothetical protein
VVAADRLRRRHPLRRPAGPQAFLSDLAFNQQTRHDYKGLVGASTSFGPVPRACSRARSRAARHRRPAGMSSPPPARTRGDRAAAVVLQRAPRSVRPDLPRRATRPCASWPRPCPPGRPCRRPRPAHESPPAMDAGAAGRPRPRARRPWCRRLVVRLFFVDSRYAAARWLEANVPGVRPRWTSSRTTPATRRRSRRAPAHRAHALARDGAARPLRGRRLRLPREGAPWLVLTRVVLRALPRPSRPGARAGRFFARPPGGRGGYAWPHASASRAGAVRPPSSSTPRSWC